MAIPPIGAKIKRELVIASHPDFEARCLDYRLWRHCYEGSGGFAPKLKRINKEGSENSAREYLAALEKDEEIETYLVPHGREHAEDFKDRLEQAHIVNFVKHRGIKPITGFLCKTEPQRLNHPPEFKDWRDNATVDGLGFDEWKIKEGVPYGLTYGALPAVIDSDPHTAETKEEQLNQQAETAKLRVIHPETIHDWRYGRGGRLESIKYKATVEDPDILGVNKTKDRWVIVNPKGWCFFDDSEKTKNQAELVVAGSGYWPWVGKNLPQRSPIVQLNFGESMLCDIAPMWKRFFNMLSELGELERNQIPVFYTPEDAADSTPQPGQTLEHGTHNWIGCPPDSPFAPGFASPDPVCLNHYLEMIKQYPEWVQELMSMASIFGAQAEAAATLAYRFQCTNEMLRNNAACLGRFENDCAEVVMLWHGKRVSDSISTEYNHSFDAVATERKLENISRLKQDIGPLPPTGEMIAQKEAFYAVFPDVEDEDKKTLEAEWKLQAETPPEPPPVNPDDATDPESVPRPGGNVAGNVGGQRA